MIFIFYVTFIVILRQISTYGERRVCFRVFCLRTVQWAMYMIEMIKISTYVSYSDG